MTATGDNIIELDRAPGTAGLYRRAALRLLPVVGGRPLLPVRRRPTGPDGTGARTGTDPGSEPPALPDTTLLLRGVRVDRARLAAYDRVCGFPLTDALPPTYPHVLAFPLAMALMSGPDFPLPVVGLVHVANRVQVLRPVDAGEPLDLAVHATDLRLHDRGMQFDVVATASTGGERVWRGVSTYLHRQGGGTRDRHGKDAGDPRGDGARDRQPAPVPHPAGIWRVGARVGTDYAAVSADRNPIHTSRLGARVFGFPRPIAHGMWSKARCVSALYPRLPGAYTVDVAFKRPILLPSTVAFSAGLAASAGPGGWRFALHGANDGEPHLAGALTPDPGAADTTPALPLDG